LFIKLKQESAIFIKIILYTLKNQRVDKADQTSINSEQPSVTNQDNGQILLFNSFKFPAG